MFIGGWDGNAAEGCFATRPLPRAVLTIRVPGFLFLLTSDRIVTIIVTVTVITIVNTVIYFETICNLYGYTNS